MNTVNNYDNALKKLESLLNEIKENRNEELKRIIKSKNEVYGNYQSFFSPEVILNLPEERFKEFLLLSVDQFFLFCDRCELRHWSVHSDKSLFCGV